MNISIEGRDKTTRVPPQKLKHCMFIIFCK